MKLLVPSSSHSLTVSTDPVSGWRSIVMLNLPDINLIRMAHNLGYTININLFVVITVSFSLFADPAETTPKITAYLDTQLHWSVISNVVQSTTHLSVSPLGVGWGGASALWK